MGVRPTKVGPLLVVEVDVAAADQAEELVRELEHRRLDAAKAVERDTVRVAIEPTDGGDPLLEPLDAVEAWLDQRGLERAPVRVVGEFDVVRPRDPSGNGRR